MNNIDFKETKSCTNDQECGIQYKTFSKNKDSKWHCNNNICKIF